MYEVKIPVSIGELVDKITILQIKSKKISNEDQLVNIERELHALEAAHRDLSLVGADGMQAELLAVNRRLWDAEDAIRLAEAEGNFGPEFVALARSVYQLNDIRFSIKKKLNQTFCSSLVEEKSYEHL